MRCPSKDRRSGERREQGFQTEPHVRMYVKPTLTVSMWIEPKLLLENNEHDKCQEWECPLSQQLLQQEDQMMMRCCPVAWIWWYGVKERRASKQNHLIRDSQAFKVCQGEPGRRACRPGPAPGEGGSSSMQGESQKGHLASLDIHQEELPFECKYRSLRPRNPQKI